MCGISGYIDFEEKVNKRILHAMTEIIRYRGPDDEGYMLFNKSGWSARSGKDTARGCGITCSLLNDPKKDYWMGFGHRRLSIIDLSAAGHQPMADAKRELVITFNGEIYNYPELRIELEELGATFKTNTDTEVILKAYEQWGEECVKYFNGMWAFAIYDKQQEKLFCSRDRLGAKPFYYYHKGNHMVFGSEIKQLCQDDHLERHMNEQRLLTTMILRIQDFSEDTLIKGVYALRPGYNLTVKLNLDEEKIVAVETKQYWELDTAGIKEEENTWYTKIKKAIRLRLRSDAPVGIMVSGGIDSTFLLNEICKYKVEANPDFPKDFNTFTTCYENAPNHDETSFAHKVNEAWGTKENLIYPDETDTLRMYKKMVWHFEDQVGFGALGSFMTMEQVSKSGVKVIINGQGGDESMLGYERYYAYYLKDIFKKNPLRGIRLAPFIVKNSKLSYKLLLEYIIYFGSPRIRLKTNVGRSRKLLNKDFIKRYDEKEALSVLTSRSLDELLFNELRRTQLTHILRMDDRMYMAFSMESRVPFIDYAYLEDVTRLSPMKKIQEGYTKYLLREKMQGTIPDEVIWRREKNGWSSPAERWVDRFDKVEMEDMLSNPVSGGYFNMEYVREQWKRNPTSKEMEAFLSTEIFMREFRIA